MLWAGLDCLAKSCGGGIWATGRASRELPWNVENDDTATSPRSGERGLLMCFPKVGVSCTITP